MAQLRKNIHKHATNSAFQTPPAQLNLETVKEKENHPGLVKYIDRLTGVFRFIPWEKNEFYQLFFHPGRGVGPSFAKYSDKAEVEAPGNPGYTPPPEETFKGWSFHPDDPSAEVYGETDIIPLEKEISDIYAYFSRAEVKLTFWANNGTEVKHEHYVDAGTHWYPVQLFDPPDPRLHFLGWNKDKTAMTGTLKGVFTVKAKGLDFYSIWSHALVEFFANGGFGEMDAAVIDSEKSYTLPGCDFIPPNPWEYFIGWAFSPTQEIIPSPTIPVDGYTALYAKWTPYKLSFDPNGGSGTMAPISADAEYFTLPTSSFVAPGGKVFMGWSYTPTGEVIPDTQIKADRDITLYAQYRAIVIHFNSGAGTGTMDDATMTSGWFLLPASTFTPPLKQHFTGWSYEPGGEIITELAINPTQDTTLYANYDYNYWTVSFDKNGGTGSKEPIKIMEGYFDIPENTFFTPPNGKRYLGWALHGSDKPLDSNHIYVDKDITIFAIYGNITVSYNANGGSGSQRDRIIDSWTFPVPKITTFTPPAKMHFAGWAYTPTGEIIKTDTIQVIDNLTLYAMWEENTWTVTWDANGGSGSVDPTVMPEGNLDLPYCPFTPPDGMRFLGWSRMRTAPVIPESSIYVNQDMTIYAIYTKVKVTFNPGSGTGAMMPVYLDSWEYTLPGCEFTPPPGYKFEGWSYTTGGEVITTPTITVKNDITLYANYVTDNIKLKFNGNGGTGAMADLDIIRTIAFELPENEFTPPEDSKFGGWKIDELGDVIYQPGDKVAIKSNYGATAFAQWLTTKHKVDFDGNGGTGTMATRVADERELFELPDSEFTPPEHEHWEGWAYEPDGPIITGE